MELTSPTTPLVPPRRLGYRMPAEWAPHWGTWMTWPSEQNDSFRGSPPLILKKLCELITQLARQERVFVNVWDEAMADQVRSYLTLPPELATAVSFHFHPSYEPWCRDHGPVFIVEPSSGQKAIVDWGYNAWGGKYPPFDLDNKVPRHIAELRNLPRFEPNMILEGGSIEVNGSGLLLTTEQCLLHPNRNPELGRDDIETRIKDYLGVDEILWLGEGIAGDDTDGHIDDITRFVNPSTIVTVIEPDPTEVNYQPLQDNRKRLEAFRQQSRKDFQIIELPMPQPVFQEGIRLPASYANFYLANKIAIVPTYDDPSDATALRILQELMPERKVIGINSRDLIWGLGSFHCLTQQEPMPAKGKAKSKLTK